MPAHLDPSELVEVKRLLWLHYSQVEVARMVIMDPGHVSKIANGKQHASLPWPDGSVGPLPSAHKATGRSYRKMHRGEMERYIASYRGPLHRPDTPSTWEGYFASPLSTAHSAQDAQDAQDTK